MKISIAMATYNGERFLQEQLDSLAAQTHLPCELVVGDDGSTDGTLDILERFAATAPFPVHIHRNPVNLGSSDNFLQTANRCTGDWIAFCDQDDFWLPKKIEKAHKIIVAHTKIDLVIVGDIHTDMYLREDHREPNILWPDSLFMLITPSLRTVAAHRMIFRRTLVTDYPWDSRPLEQGQRQQLVHDRWIGMLTNIFGKRYLTSEYHTLFRRHVMAETYKKKQSRSEKIQSFRQKSSDVFAEEMRIWLDLAKWCERTEKSAPVKNAIAIEKCHRIARWYETRARVYSATSTFGSKLYCLCSLICSGAYLSGFGLKPLAKDFYFVLF